MKAVLICCVLGLPLAARAQRLITTTLPIAATAPPITYHVGVQKAPLYHGIGDTVLQKPNLYLPSQAEAIVVGKFSPGWVVVKHEGFLYLTPISALRDYDPADAAPQPLDPQTQRLTYQGIVEVPGVDQAALYARAAAWVAKAYGPADATVQRQDPAAGELLLKGARLVHTYAPYKGVLRGSYAGVVRHTLAIYVKDGRYKYILTDLTHDAAGTPNLRSGGPLEQDKVKLFGYVGLGSRKTWDDLKVEATRDARTLMADLQEAMTLQKPTAILKKPSDF